MFFYRNIIALNEYTFYYNLDHEGDKFEIYNINNNIFSIKRIDSNFGWGQFIILKVIYKNNIYNINIGNSCENDKKFIVK
jgi:hypothetical protein